jgi:hypothetical protein
VAAVQLRPRGAALSEVATTGLVDLLDGLFDTGVGVQGDVTLAVADVDLVRLRLRALLASVEAEERAADGRERVRHDWVPPARMRRRTRPELPNRIDAEPESLDRGLAQLVLVVVDLLREVMERQAIRRLQSGSLDENEVERLSEAFGALDERLDELYADFGLLPALPA